MHERAKQTIPASLAGSHGMCASVVGMELIHSTSTVTVAKADERARLRRLLSMAQSVALLSHCDTAFSEEVHRDAAGAVVELLREAEALLSVHLK